MKVSSAKLCAVTGLAAHPAHRSRAARIAARNERRFMLQSFPRGAPRRLSDYNTLDRFVNEETG